MAPCTLDSLLACVALREEAPGRWRGSDLGVDRHRLFGGQLLAQVVSVAAATGDGKVVTSVACVFPRRGSVEAPLDLVVDRCTTAVRSRPAASQGEQRGRAVLGRSLPVPVVAGGCGALARPHMRWSRTKR